MNYKRFRDVEIGCGSIYDGIEYKLRSINEEVQWISGYNTLQSENSKEE